VHDDILGPFGEVLALRSALEDEVGGQGLGEEAFVHRFVHELLQFPGNRAAMFRVIERDPLAPDFAIGDDALARYVADQIRTGSLVLRRQTPEEAYHARSVNLPDTGEGDMGEPDDPADREEKIQDWKIECAHHAAGKRPVFERRNSIQIVPDKGQTKDMVKVHWRNDHLGSMPPELEARCTGHDDVTLPQDGALGAYTTYAHEFEYKGDIDNFLFPLPSFWDAFAEKTNYRISPGPGSITVEVFNPRQWGLEITFPPLKGLKAGFKYSVQRELQGDSVRELKLAEHTSVKETATVETTGWKKSSLGIPAAEIVSSEDSWTNGQRNAKKADESKSRVASGIKLTRDGNAMEIDAIKMVASLLEFVQAVLGLVDTVKSWAPQVGWYVDLDIQLLQGGIAGKMHWQEHTDHRVFRYVDVNMKVTLFSITFELGVGVSAFSFKVQAFAQISGDLSVEVSGNRYTPEGDWGANIGPIKGTIKGAIGARAEAGYVFKAEAKAETALELDLVLGINQGARGQLVNIDGGLVWTGITVTATGSVGAFGVGGTKTWSGVLVPPSKRMRFEWPKPVEYKPPYMSRDAIQRHLKTVLTKSWDVRVFTEIDWGMDERWSTDRVADRLADRIERDTAFHRTPAMVEALGIAIRKDLDALGRGWGRDWIAADKFEQYVDGSVSGRSLQSHLNAGRSPLAGLG